MVLPNRVLGFVVFGKNPKICNSSWSFFTSTLRELRCKLFLNRFACFDVRTGLAGVIGGFGVT